MISSNTQLLCGDLEKYCNTNVMKSYMSLIQYIHHNKKCASAPTLTLHNLMLHHANTHTALPQCCNLLMGRPDTTGQANQADA